MSIEEMSPLPMGDFGRFPSELRNHIYSLCLVRTHQVRIEGNGLTTAYWSHPENYTRLRENPAQRHYSLARWKPGDSVYMHYFAAHLLQVSRTIRDEATWVLYGMNRFQFPTYGDLTNFLETIGPNNATHISDIEIPFPSLSLFHTPLPENEHHLYKNSVPQIPETDSSVFGYHIKTLKKNCPDLKHVRLNFVETLDWSNTFWYLWDLRLTMGQYTQYDKPFRRGLMQEMVAHVAKSLENLPSQTHAGPSFRSPWLMDPFTRELIMKHDWTIYSRVSCACKSPDEIPTEASDTMTFWQEEQLEFRKMEEEMTKKFGPGRVIKEILCIN